MFLKLWKRQKRFGAFTLIELLVVIAIIMLLAAILLPVFEKARERAQIASCTSNVKNLSLAIIQYVDDYDGYLPHYGNPARVNANGTIYLDGSSSYGESEKSYAYFGWVGGPSEGPYTSGSSPDPDGRDDALWQQDRVVTPYVKDMGATLCPTWGAKRLFWGANNNGVPGTAGQFLGNSYAINTRLIFPGGWPDGRSQGGDSGFGYVAAAQRSVKLNEINYPEFTGLISDGYMAWGGMANGTVANFHHSNGTDVTTSSGSISQGVLCTYGFVDGHAKAMNPNSWRRGNLAYYEGGRISWMDDRFRDKGVGGQSTTSTSATIKWDPPGSVPTSGRPG